MAIADRLDELYDWEGSKDELEGLMRKHIPQLLRLSFEDANDALAVDIAFDLTNPRVKDVIDTLAKRVRNVSDTTLEQIRGWVDTGTEQGLAPAEIARQIRANAGSMTQARALTIARTETREAYNGGALLAYDTVGVNEVEALDSDEDPECAARNGQRFTLEEAAAVDAHPNCVLAWAPVVD